MTMKFWDVLSATSTYLKLHIWTKIHWIMLKLQQQDKQLLALQVKYSDNHVNLHLDDYVNDIICCEKDPAQHNWKIALLESMVVDTSNGSTKWWDILVIKNITWNIEPTLSPSQALLSHQ